MSVGLTREKLAWLAEAASSGQVHTIRVSWGDRLGTWRGKRLPVDVFLGSPDRRLGFCDGMIVVDVNCDVIQETPFSNFETGYPDMYLRSRLDTLAPVGWSEGEAFILGSLEDHHGSPLQVAPRNVLDSVLSRLEATGVELRARLTLGGRLMRGPGEPMALLPDGKGRDEEGPGVLRAAAEGLALSGVAVQSIEAEPDGRFRLMLALLPAAAAADQALVAKAALKEVARSSDRHAVFMTLLPGEPEPAALELELEVLGASMLDPELVARLLAPVRVLLQPSVNAFKAGPAAAPSSADTGKALVLEGLRAGVEADPASALLAIAGAIGASLEADAAPPAAAEPEGLGGAADQLEGCSWARDWFGSQLIDNTVPLLRHEAMAFRSAVTDWELARYWSAG
jgi:glutamine synthetase